MSGARALVPASIRVALPKDVMKKVAHIGVDLGVPTPEAAARIITLAVKDYQPETLAGPPAS